MTYIIAVANWNTSTHFLSPITILWLLFLMHVSVARKELAPAFKERPTQTEATDATTPEATSLIPCESCPGHMYEPVHRLFHLAKTTKSIVCYGDHLCREGARNRASRRKSTGDFLRDGAAATARWGFVLDSHPKKTKREHKSLKPGRGALHELGILEVPCEAALLDLDNCLQRSLDTS